MGAGAARGADSAAIPCTVTADSVHARFRPELAFDGDETDTESRWASAKTPEPHWIALLFAEPVALDRVRIVGHPGDLALRDAELQVRRAGQWVQVGRIEGNTQSLVELTFPQQTTDGVRLLVTKACVRDSCVRLFEVELFRGAERLALRAAPPPAPAAERPLSPSRLVTTVEPIANTLLSPRPRDARGRRLMAAYYGSIRAWGAILRERAEPVPGMAHAIYYGRGGNREDDIRPIGYAALVNAFLATIRPGDGEPGDDEREAAAREAIGALRYLTQTHVTGSEECADGGQWGNQWQSAMWARSAGLAGWLLWDQLDAELRTGVARVVEFEADRFLKAQPKSSEFRDTGAEENAWNAQIIALACNMMPAHPRAERWAEATRLWMYNSLSVAADSGDDTPGDNARPVREWVTTVNAHPDFTVENHGIVHVGYLKTTIAMLLEGAVPYFLTGSDPPKACLHHAEDAFRVLMACMGWDGSPVFFSGNDWKLVHTQNSDVIVYALLGLLAGDRHAAHLEDVALRYVRRMQEVEGGYYNVRRDIEFGGLCATRLIGCYLAHGILGPGTKPASVAEFDRAAGGVTHLEHAKAIVHRTRTKFASFSWGPKCMALALPRNGTWVVWPHFASYTGNVALDGEPPGEQIEKDFHPELRPDGFSVTGLLRRHGGALEQAISYTSLPGDVTVYVERLTPGEGFGVASRETGIIGLEYELGGNERTLHGRHGLTQAVGVGGEDAQVVEMPTDWLNIDGRLGYVVRRTPDTQNLMRYHDEVAGSGRVPKLQEWISLVGDAEDSGPAQQPSWACVVTLLNQRAGKTASMAEQVEFVVEGETATCRVGDATIHVDFATMETELVGVD